MNRATPSLRMLGTGLGMLAAAVLAPAPALAAGKASVTDLMDLKLRDLMDVTVTSPSKREQRYYATAAALFVITQDDIRRSGARSIPEALRLAPGVNVQQINANQYSVSIRGQNDLFSNKLLVLMDGRPVYTPTFSGVWWPALNYPLQDIDRIEVLRGPSGAVWGANAVNGVINIITKNAHATKGIMISGGTGSHEKGFGTIRAAGTVGHAAFRVYGMREKRGAFLQPSGQRAPDQRKFDQGGFRLDWDKGDTKVSLHGDSYQVRAGAYGIIVSQAGAPAVPYTSENLYTGRNLVLKVQDSLTAGTQLETQAFYDQTTLSTPFFGERRDTYDLDVQLNLSQLPRQLISLGYDIRSSNGRITDTPVLQLPSQRDVLHSYFLNDDIRIMDGLHLILGTKIERNRYTDWQTEPNARMIYTADTWAVWTAYSQAVRAPNMVENGIRFNAKGYPGAVARLYGTGIVRPERVESYEAGYRFFPDNDTLLQATVFQMNYRGVSDAHQQAMIPPGGGTPYAVIPVYLMNLLDGRVIGVEGDVTYRLSDWAKFKGTISYMDQVYWPNPVNDAEARTTAFTVTQKTPRLQYTAGLSLDPIPHVEMDVNLYHFDAFRASVSGKGYDVKAYTRLDARIGWRPDKHLEIALIGKNLLQQTHREETSNFLENASLIEQSYLCMATLHY